MAAHAALEHGINLEVPLPFERERYVRDFVTTSSKDEFDALCAQAVAAYVVEGSGYYNVGSYVAQTSDILLALWDLNFKKELPGGTAHIVRCQFEGFPDEGVWSGYVPNRQTYIITTPRVNDEGRAISGGFWTADQYLALKG
ncbi:hypothetical protein EJF36_18825 [Bacillus sp. HMF5848]|uniref:hypothetical protein n=1 Tax=Bacillus sp. HMF5848 TaxID=2495421 RepID=UPI000F790B84|nr:hypothetical protein [Bacillus sp. HMF5848]RSK28761.1 hypothetical protein EJF36_18825 [Bacillus sp. HMF5848]